MDGLVTKAERCRALHAAAGTFVSGGCWNPGTAKLLAHIGLPLLETTSSGAMFAMGLPDAVGLATRDFMLGNAREIAAAVDIPVMADLENGFGDSPEAVAETIRQAGLTGIVGGSIEDATGRPDDPIYAFGLARERIQAAAEAARALPIPFTLTARADQYLHGRPDLPEAIRRAQAFQEAGADVVLVPGLMDPSDLRTLCGSVDVPVAALVGSAPDSPGPSELSAIGVRRISAGGALVRVALSAFMNAARDILEGRDVDFGSGLVSGRELNTIFRPHRDATGKPGPAPLG